MQLIVDIHNKEKYMKPEQYLHDFSIIHRYSVMRHIKEMKESRITGHQMGYIVHIQKNPGASQEDISAFFRLNKGTVAKGIKRLLDDGYILRKQNENDKRAYRLYLTDMGEKLFAESERSIVEFNNILTAGMTEDEVSLFRELLTKATNNVIDAAGEYKEDLMRPGPPPGAPDCCKENI